MTLRILAVTIVLAVLFVLSVLAGAGTAALIAGGCR